MSINTGSPNISNMNQFIINKYVHYNKAVFNHTTLINHTWHTYDKNIDVWSKV